MTPAKQPQIPVRALAEVAPRMLALAAEIEHAFMAASDSVADYDECCAEWERWTEGTARAAAELRRLAAGPEAEAMERRRRLADLQHEEPYVFAALGDLVGRLTEGLICDFNRGGPRRQHESRMPKPRGVRQ